MRKWLLLMFVSALCCTSVDAELDSLPRGMEHINKQGAQLDLDKIKERGYIRVLTRNNPACYFMHRGQLMGFEYELVHHFARKHDLEVVVIVPESWGEMQQWLQEGRADLIAACVTITPSRLKHQENLRFCHPYGEVFEMIVTRSNDDSIKSLQDLEGRTVHVRAGSSYQESLETLREQLKIKFKIALVPDDVETFEILDRVAKGTYDITCADDNFLDQNVRLGVDLKAVLKLNNPRSYGWMVRSNQPRLYEAINRFMEKEIDGSTYNTLYRRYFQMRLTEQQQREYNPANPGEISPYDPLIRKHAETYEFPWMLICSQMFQESSFRPDAVSWSGAQGLMQLMPATAKEVGVRDPFDPDQNIRGGVYYLKKQYDRVPDEVDSVNRTCFALAAYNGGYGHLIDARKLAGELGRNPNVWMDNVDHAYALLSRPDYAQRARYGYCRSDEIIGYVRKIMARYIGYEASRKN